MRIKLKQSYINIFKLLLLANKDLSVTDCGIKLNVENLTICRYMARLRKAGFKIRTTRKDGVILDQEPDGIQNIINLLEKL